MDKKLKKELRKEILVFLDAPDTEFLYKKAGKTKDIETLIAIMQRAKKIFSQNLSETDQIINKLKNI
jgi:hypothetical protein